MPKTAPIAPSAIKPSSGLSRHAFQDGPRRLTGLFRWAVFALTGYMIVELFSTTTIAFLIWLYLPSTIVPFDMATLQTIDMFIIGGAIAQIVMFWVSAVLVARITYRAMRNLYTVGSDIAEMSPGWTVGWYFIPIASLFKPAEGMSQIVHGTRKAVGEKPFVSTAIPIWWTCWLLTNILATVAGQIVNFSGISIDTWTQITAFSFDAASSIFGILSAWSLMRVLRPTVEKQELLKHGGVAHVFD
nr:DUF4328 domain-containing protein [Hyphomonas sp. Mor2]